MTPPGNIQIDSDAVREIVARGIVESLGDEQRRLVIQQAVNHLLEVPKDTYGRASGESPLQQAFNVAVRQAANDVVKGMLAEPEIRATVDAAIRDKVNAMLASEGGWLYATIGVAVGDRIEQIMRGDR